MARAQFNYTDNGDGTATITGGPGGDVNIPSTINGLLVTSIGYEAFYNGASPGPGIVSSVTIPDSVTNIGAGAFAWNYTLRSATLGNGLRSIGAGAFADCGLTTITIPRSVSSIGDLAFAYCALTGVYFLGNAPSLGGPSVFQGFGAYPTVYYVSGTTGWGPTFGGCPTALWFPPPSDYTYTTANGTITITGYTGPGGDVTIPDTIIGLPVTGIGNNAFAMCSSMTNVTIPDSVTTIGDSAFEDCTSLLSVSIPSSVTSIGDWAFTGCAGLTSVTIPNSLTSIAAWAFGECSSLTNIIIPNSVNSIVEGAFASCTSLANIIIPNSVNSLGDYAFNGCSSLTSVTIPDSVPSIGNSAFNHCTSLASVTIGKSVTSIGEWGFGFCSSLAGVYFQGNAPSLGGTNVFSYDNDATIYYLPGTTGWGPTFGGRLTAVWIQAPTIQMTPLTQTAEAASDIALRVKASSPLPLFYLWYLNATNLLSSGTNWQLALPNLQLSQSGAYTVVISNASGTVTSAPAMLNVIAPVERRPVPGVEVTGQTGSFVNVDYADSLSPAPNWTPLGSVILTSTPQYCVDLTLRLPPQRFYRAWQTGTTGVRPSLDLLPVPAITLTGTIGGSVRVDYINQFGPTDAWVTLATVPLTNTSQLYFDTSSIGQPARLYRLVQVP